MRIHELNNEDMGDQGTFSGNDSSVIEITESNRWMMLIIGMALMFGALVVASYIGWNIPGITTVKEVPVIKEIPQEIIKEVPKEVEKPVSVPVLPQQIWIDAPGNIPGCFPIFIHIRYGNGELRSYRFDICGRW